jgi:hypothetical protein
VVVENMEAFLTTFGVLLLLIMVGCVLTMMVDPEDPHVKAV